MEELLGLVASWSALILEAVVALLVMYGALEALVRMAGLALDRSDPVMRRRIWMNFAQWIILALEFALGADIIRTAIAPTWDDVGKLAAIAAIRTGLSFFLERDIEAFGPGEEKKPRPSGSAAE
ncbi:DUF1622 domain-containing protein [Novosphingobium guangzhouense]|uniref:DUF1622 domain-containing protein n=1 Tax=Novosphingobium guangzhouense TaxID=1850347 RepID=A0A2K2FZ00_9SPHN|nr:DUF1622 domain-containing protein [Novosphingobium guangzhouense]PNU04016.1 hypothetical protein A8V01_05210 [Novosphingobium guangzhouense]